MPDFQDSWPIVKGASELYNSTQNQVTRQVANNRGDLLVAQSLPTYAELVRLGRVWSMRTATASAFNLVAALPTTLATAILHNAEATGGKSYIIFNIFVTSIVTTTALTSLSLLAQVTPSPLGVSTAPTHSASTTLLTSRSGRASYDGLAKRAINVTTFFTDGWDVVGVTAGAATASIGTGVYADVNGSIVIPPGGSLGMNVLAGTVATASGIIGCTWGETQVSLGV